MMAAKDSRSGSPGAFWRIRPELENDVFFFFALSQFTPFHPMPADVFVEGVHDHQAV